jgi:photosystem II stability/assembly factor-like uncharacterized protein
VGAARGRRFGLLLACAAALPAAAPLRAATDRVNRPVEAARLASRSLLLDVARAGTRLVAVGDRGHVLLSDDQGASWRQSLKVPSRTMLTAVAFADARNGCAVGHDEIILRTTDAGESWTRSHYAPDTQQPLLDVLFTDAQRGIAVGAYGSYFTTTDGGGTWEPHKFEHRPLVKPAAPPDPNDIPPDYHLNHIVAAGQRLYIAAEAGQVYRSDDGGANWVSLPSPYNGSFFGLLPLGGDALLVFGLRGNMFRSDDAGVTWRRVDTGSTAMLTDGVAIDAARMAIVGLSGTVLLSADGGATWRLEQQADRKGLSAALLLPSGELLAVGEDGARAVRLQ